MNEGVKDCGKASAGRYSHQGCRCEACTLANREKAARYRAGKPKGLLDAEPVKRRLMRLYEQGYTAREVSRITGISCKQLLKIARAEKGEKVRRSTKDALCAIHGQRRLKAGSKVDASWMAEWIEGYVACGMSTQEVADALGLCRATIGRIRRTRRTTAGVLRAFVARKKRLDVMRRTKNEGHAA